MTKYRDVSDLIRQIPTETLWNELVRRYGILYGVLKRAVHAGRIAGRTKIEHSIDQEVEERT